MIINLLSHVLACVNLATQVKPGVCRYDETSRFSHWSAGTDSYFLRTETEMKTAVCNVTIAT